MVLKPGTMATGTAFCLPNPLEDGDAKAWFRQFDECADANNWKAVKKLVGIPLLLMGQAWNIYKLFGEGDNESYDVLKYTTISRLNHDINEDWLTAHEQLT